MKKLDNKISIAGIFLFCTIVVGFVFVQTPLNLRLIPDGGGGTIIKEYATSMEVLYDAPYQTPIEPVVSGYLYYTHQKDSDFLTLSQERSSCQIIYFKLYFPAGNYEYFRFVLYFDLGSNCEGIFVHVKYTDGTSSLGLYHDPSGGPEDFQSGYQRSLGLNSAKTVEYVFFSLDDGDPYSSYISVDLAVLEYIN